MSKEKKSKIAKKARSKEGLDAKDVGLKVPSLKKIATKVKNS